MATMNGRSRLPLLAHAGSDAEITGAALRILPPQPQFMAITGTDAPETLNGTPGDDEIFGLGGNDILNGLDGNDKLYGGTGADSTDGGAGNDWHFIDNPGDIVIEGAGGGSDRVFASVSYTLGAGSEVELFTTDFHAGGAAIDLTGNELANVIYGNDGNNVVNGGAGADSMVGRKGNDSFFIDNAGDVVTEAVGEGSDRVFASASYALTPGAEIEMLTTDLHVGTAAINLTGNEFANVIYGNDGANVLDGGAGNDTLYGLGGNDVFRASDGLDVFHGGFGDDWFFVNDAADAAFDIVGQGSDRLFTSVSYTLRTGAEIELFTTDYHAGTAAIDLTGNDQKNTIYGNQGNNVLDGKAGDDVLIGGGGADTFTFTIAPRVFNPTNFDTVYDFEHGVDKVALDDAVFKQIGTLGAFNASVFVIGSAAGDADDRIIYNSATGQLYYDEDGNGAMAAQLFATFQGAPTLTASDFIVI